MNTEPTSAQHLHFMLSSVVNDVYSVLNLVFGAELPAFICTWIVSNQRICSKLAKLTLFPLGHFYIYSALLQHSVIAHKGCWLQRPWQKYDFNLSGCEHKTCREPNNHNKETKDSTLLDKLSTAFTNWTSAANVLCSTSVTSPQLSVGSTKT